jgi:DNA repair exonuclease SbcCD ATPase subunit
MRLTKIQLTNFKRFSDYGAEFSPGINVVKGPLNEMGKSTLLEGIIVALFHNPRSMAKEIRDYAAWGSTRQFRTSLEFEHEGNRYLVEKDFDKGTARLSGGHAREELDTFKQVSERMAELLGTKSDRLFLCSCCIRQSQVTEVSSGKKEIGESLEEVVTGGKESTLASQVLQKLDGKIADMKRGLDKLAKNPGILADLKNRVQDVSRKYSEVQDEVSRVEAHKVELVEVDGQLAEVKNEYEKCRALLEKNKQRKEIEASVERLNKDYSSVEELRGSINRHQEDFKKADEALGLIEGFTDKQQVLEFRGRLDDLRRKRSDIGKDLAERERELAEAKGKLDRRKSVTFLGSEKGIAGAAAVLAGGIIGTLVGPLYLLSLVVVGAALLAISMRARTALIRDRVGISGVEERIQRMKEFLDELGRDEQELLTEARCQTSAEFNDREKSFYHWLQKKEEARYRLEGILSGKATEDIEKRRSEIIRKLAVEEARLTEDLVETRLSPEEYVELERKVQGLEAKRNELEDRKRYGMAIIKAAKHDVEEQTGLEEELESLREALRHEEKKVRVYELAREFISRARVGTLSSADESLQGEIQRYFAIFTNGKYQRVEVNKEALEFRVYSDEKGDWVRPEDLSGGVVDEFYLAFRLALAGLIFGDKKPPLILDDPFVNFDSVRLANTLSFLKTLASDYQIIIFTLSDSYDEVADNIILLSEGDKQQRMGDKQEWNLI